MKKLAITLGLVLLLSTPSWGAGLGVGITTWDTETVDSDEGFSVRAALDMGDRFDLELRASFLDGFAQVENNALFRLEATPIDVGFSYGLPSRGKASPYVGAGATFLFADVLFDGGVEPATGRVEVNDEFGFYLVVGTDVDLGHNLAFYAEAMYRVIKTEVTADGFAFTDFEADFAGPSGTLGVMLTW